MRGDPAAYPTGRGENLVLRSGVAPRKNRGAACLVSAGLGPPPCHQADGRACRAKAICRQGDGRGVPGAPFGRGRPLPHSSEHRNRSVI